MLEQIETLETTAREAQEVFKRADEEYQHVREEADGTIVNLDVRVKEYTDERSKLLPEIDERSGDVRAADLKNRHRPVAQRRRRRDVARAVVTRHADAPSPGRTP